MSNSNSIDDLCLHYKILHDRDSTTLEDVDKTHPYYVCKICEDPKNTYIDCKDYRSKLYYKLRKDDQKKEDSSH